MYSRQDLAEGFRRLGITAGSTVMVHASIRSVGPIAGGPDQIHLALKDALTPDGTLLMYASCPAHYDEVGRGNLTPAEEREVIALLPAFDPLTARSARDNGALVELLRTWPDSIVNHHVARFVAWGRHADYLFSEQPWDYAYGRGSALERLVGLDGSILLLGCDHDTVTFLHYAEHVAEIPGKRISRYQVPVLEGGRRVWKATGRVRHGGRRRASPLAAPLLRTHRRYVRPADRAKIGPCRRGAVHAHRHARVAVVRARGDGPDSLESAQGRRTRRGVVSLLAGARGGLRSRGSASESHAGPRRGACRFTLPRESTRT